MKSVALSTGMKLAELGWMPDALLRSGIRRMVADGLRERASVDQETRANQENDLINQFKASPIALETDSANEQHYEVPTRFFEFCLGKHMKYSGCYWPDGVTNLDEAEAASLKATCEHAELADGQHILELGCGWGSLTLWMAANYPNAQITAVSNSSSQREHIMSAAHQRGLDNVNVITADMNDFAPPGTYDRVVSVEMFEHMRNHASLMQRISTWLKPGGKLFVHIFVHGRQTYLYEIDGADNWMGRYFFTGGMMPADELLYAYQDHLKLEFHAKQDGTHYQRTADAWLENLDRNRAEAFPLLRNVYGPGEEVRWFNRWRMFYLACAEMFGYDQGREWWVSHYRFIKPTG